VQGSALVVVVAESHVADQEILADGGLADEIDGTTGGPAPGIVRTRPFCHFHLRDVVGIAGIAAEIPHAVDEDVGTRAEPADAELVARRRSPFPGLHAD